MDPHPGRFCLLGNLSADIPEQRTGSVRHLIFREDTAIDVIAETPLFAEHFRQSRHHRKLLSCQRSFGDSHQKKILYLRSGLQTGLNIQ